MQAGLLNQIIEIYKPDVEINEFGEQVQKYNKVIETKAQVVHNSGNREISNSEIVNTYTKTFRVRRYIQLNETYQIKYQNRFYRVIAIEDNRKFNEKIIDTELINE